MLDTEFLRSWIKPQHLTPEALQGYKEQFAGEARLAVMEDFLVDDVAAKLASFLDSEADFRPEFGLYSVEGAVDEERWRSAAKEDRFFRYGRNVGVSPQHQFSPNALSYLRFRTTFPDDRFRAFFEEVTGLQLASSDDFGSHKMATDDYMGEHDDDNRNRRLAIVLYLTPEWRPEYGGALKVRDADGNARTIQATYNSAAIFDTQAGTMHSVEPVSDKAGDRSRATIGGWYHQPSGA
ncbi:hypothetical protein BH18ACT15_BH18ACT15_13530 [soil metagenome]